MNTGPFDKKGLDLAKVSSFVGYSVNISTLDYKEDWPLQL